MGQASELRIGNENETFKNLNLVPDSIEDFQHYQFHNKSFTKEHKIKRRERRLIV